MNNRETIEKAKEFKKEKEEELEPYKRHGVDPRTPGLWEEKWKAGDDVIMKHKVTGEERPHHYSEEEKAMIRNGDVLQPFQKDEYIERYGTLPGEDQRDVDRYIMRHLIKTSGMMGDVRKEVRRRYF